ncbi:MAG: HAMP domain-containing histidine kinase [Burkholderiales bacterium]|nr:HAMP domain-containing histidine kinase [Anaerolineae bacterium]
MTIHTVPRLPSINSIRVRLLLVYVGILVVGFAVLALVTGQQISSAARVDYENRLKNEIRLIAQGIRASITDATVSDGTFDTLIAGYEAEIGGDLTVVLPEDLDRRGPPGQQGTGPRNGPPPNSRFDGAPEIESALRGDVIVIQRRDSSGHDALFTAAPVIEGQQGPRAPVIVQLSVPSSNLQRLVLERWVSLWLLVGLIALLALIAATLLARSIIRPLDALRESAVQLAKGDFSHRVAYNQKDEIGEVARAFNEMAHQVESMLDEQRAFASNTSHELRTPLTNIRLRSEALRYDDSLDEAMGERYITEIDDEANRMSGLIEDLTLLSRFDAGRAELGENQIDMAQFAASLKQRFWPQLTAKNIRFELATQPDVQPVLASLNHLTVVFRNLIDNAIKYMPGADGGQITWMTSAGVDGVCSVIQDTGRGIEAEQLPHLFERFYRADKARSRDIPGSGLGLAIVKSIVDAYGGTVSIASAGSGKGTTVTVFWPYRPVALTSR